MTCTDGCTHTRNQMQIFSTIQVSVSWQLLHNGRKIIYLLHANASTTSKLWIFYRLLTFGCLFWWPEMTCQRLSGCHIITIHTTEAIELGCFLKDQFSSSSQSLCSTFLYNISLKACHIYRNKAKLLFFHSNVTLSVTVGAVSFRSHRYFRYA